MTMQFDHLRTFLEAFRRLHIWQRLFGWGRIRQESYEALVEFNQMKTTIELLSAEQQQQRERLLTAETSVQHLREDNASLRAEMKPLQQRAEQHERESGRLRELDEQRGREHERKILQANQLWQQLESDRRRVQAERQAEITARYEEVKRNWSVHEDLVRQRIRDICTRHQIEYKDDHPLDKKPDCVIMINGEYVIFDAKAPGDPSKSESFPTYVRNQTAEMEKYANQAGVRKEVFLVVPSEVTHRLSQLIYEIAGYRVHVITPDALEPIIFGLKRLETYENLNELSPEERELICGVIGKFVHLTKRRVQIDQHWAFEVLSMLSKARSLPQDFTDMIRKYEQSGLYNPEPDRRGRSVADERLKERQVEIDRIVEPGPKVIVASLFGD
jgi:hypothetical protein